MRRNHNVITLFPRVAKFANIIKIATMVIKTTFKDLKILKNFKKYFNVSRNKRCATCFIYLLDLLLVRYNCASL